MKRLSLTDHDVVRQGPAVHVTPVLTPSQML